MARTIRQFPHCDQRVLHAPEDNCEFCNAHPEWQELRKAWGIAFTGHSYNTDGTLFEDGQGNFTLPCPAEANRGMKSINGWHGNIAFTPEAKKEFDRQMDELKKNITEKFGLPEDDF